MTSANGKVEKTGLGAGVLNQPALGIAWLAERLNQYGDSIKAGKLFYLASLLGPWKPKKAC